MTSNGWFPKETAPKDGSWFLVLVPDSPMAWAPYEFASWTSDFTGEFYFCETDTSERIDFDWWQPLPPANLVPARPLSSITDEEAYECFQIAFGKPISAYQSVGANPEENGIEIYGYEYSSEVDRVDITILKDGSMAAAGTYLRGSRFCPFFNVPALVNYLRSIGIAFESAT